MSGPKRNPDRLNTIGVIVVGICGAVLVYVTIVALEAFYVNDTSEIQTMADYGGQDTSARSLRAEQLSRVNEYGTNPRPAAAKANEPQRPQTYRIPIDVAMKLVAEGAKADPGGLIPALGPSDKATVLPIFGRPRPIPAAPAPAAPTAPPAGAPPAGAPPTGAPPAGAPPAGAGSGSATDLPAAPMVPTGTGTGPAPVSGAGALDKSAAPSTPGNPTGPAASKAAPTTPAPVVTPPKGNGK
ncbi:MAG: hypothetical protein E6J90_46175 [Deltaproteobacteria bacterium]|nr:MAG: hypothetical protein E6J90_46175 [Deltaproteobacteria bacterium]TMQ14899.1 MAG: hypothetical protein E6J91_14420 [Deltaproteobacteria bacterium]